MKEYQARTINFKEIVNIDDWRIKIYTISKDGTFNHPEFYKNVKARLPEWLAMENSFDSSNDKIGFLILHPATEGIFSLINWWVGENMLNTHVFLSPLHVPAKFTKISGDGLGACVWEMEVINHERLAWISHVLRQAPSPNYDRYLKDVCNATI